MSEYDYVFVGGEINALVAAAMLGKKLRTALVLERNSAIGGCLRSEEVTAPGFVHDIMATTLVLFRTSPAYQALGKDLEARGFAMADTNLPTAVLRPDGSSVILSMDRARNVKTFDALAEGDGAAFAAEMDALGADAPFLFSLLGGSLWSSGIAKTLARELWRRGPRNLAAWFGEALAPARGYLETAYRSDAVRDLWAPWVLHTGLGPESAYSAAMVRVIAFAVEAAGCPIAVGGAKTLLAAFERLIVDQGGAVRPSADVARIIPGPGSRAGGVELASGEKITAAKGVICSTGPEQLYNGLLKDWPTPAPAEVRRGLKSFRHGKGDMQIHYALKSSATLARRSGSRQGRAHTPDKRTGRRFARRERGRTRPPAGGADDLRRPADRARSKPRAAGRGDPLAADARGAALREGRRGRRDRSARGWPLDGGHARVLRRPHRADGSPRISRTGPRSSSRAARTRRRTSRR